MAGSSVVGLGAGVIILLILWTLTAIAWVQLSQKQSGIRILITFISVGLTLLLILIPTADHSPGGGDAATINPDLLNPQDAFQIYDYMFIWKSILMLMMFCSTFLALGVYTKEFWSVKVHGANPPLRNKFQEYN